MGDGGGRDGDLGTGGTFCEGKSGAGRERREEPNCTTTFVDDL